MFAIIICVSIAMICVFVVARPLMKVHDFYATDEMIGYHQSAYITQYLKETYGTDKLRDFWQKGFAGFEKVYGKSWNEMEKDINRKVREMYAEVPDINWDLFSEGCKS